jgi:hypothetical protein
MHDSHVEVPGGVRAPDALPEPGHSQLHALQDHVQGRAEQDQAPHQVKVRAYHFVVSECDPVEFGKYDQVGSFKYGPRSKFKYETVYNPSIALRTIRILTDRIIRICHALL